MEVKSKTVTTKLRLELDQAEVEQIITNHIFELVTKSVKGVIDIDIGEILPNVIAIATCTVDEDL